MNKLHPFYLEQVQNILTISIYQYFFGHFLNIEEKNSWTIKLHSYEIINVNSLKGVFQFPD